MSRGVLRAKNATGKIRETREHDKTLNAVNEELKEIQVKAKELKVAKAQLAVMRLRKRKHGAESSSSGRVLKKNKVASPGMPFDCLHLSPQHINYLTSGIFKDTEYPAVIAN